VEVHRVRVEQVGTLDHAHIGQREIELLPFLQFDGGGRLRGRQNTGIDAGIDGAGAGLDAGQVGKAEGIHLFAVRHDGIPVAAGDVHAARVRRLDFAPGPHGVAVRVPWTLHKRRRPGLLRHGEGRRHRQRNQPFA
jgi:hypothetical protein